MLGFRGVVSVCIVSLCVGVLKELVVVLKLRLCWCFQFLVRGRLFRSSLELSLELGNYKVVVGGVASVKFTFTRKYRR